MEHSGDHEFCVIVVGAGIMGSSAAYNIAKRGHRTLLLEQFDFLHHRGSSHGESRTIRATYPEDYYHHMVLESSSLWKQAESEIGYKVYFKSHQLDMGPSDDSSLLAVIANCRKFSAPFTLLDARQLQLAHKFSVPNNWVGVSTRLGGVLKPTKAVSMFQTLAIKNGAVLRDHSEVTNIVRDEARGGVWVFTAGGEKFYGKKCVVTVGAWMKKLVKTVAGIELPVQPLETTVCYWRIKEGHEAEFTIEGGFPTFASYGEPYIYGTPSLEFPGLIKVAVHGGNPCDPDRRPWGPVVSLAPLKRWIEERFSGMVDSGGPVATQLCMYSLMPDEDFVIDYLGGEFGDNVAVAGGFSGHGFKMGPVVGRILADLVLDGEAKGVELGPFRIDRFVGNPKGNAKDFSEQVNKNHNKD